MLISINLCT